jgi:twitching motility protein PilT
MDFDKLLVTAVERGASDLHFKPNSRPIFRVHGTLESQDDLDGVTAEFIDEVARRLLGERRYKELLDAKEMDFAHFVPGGGRFRVNMFLARGEIRMSLRAIPSKIPRFEELHLPTVLEKLATERRGMVLVTGVTGSGKSTTLAAMIDFMNRARNDHIISIEDPIEFAHEDNKCVINQREVGHDTLSFAGALRAALRQDPDIILVGEMRDAETMAVALHAAETGHLVLSTLHTLNATETVNRIISTFPPHQEDQIREQLAAVMQGIVSQRLIVRADGKGRVPAVEVMVGTGLIRDCIREAEKTTQIPAVMAAGAAQYGMQTFDQSLLLLYRQEMITYETARDAATNPDDFDLKVKGIFSAGEMTYETSKKPEETAKVPGLTGTSTPTAPAPAPSAPRPGGTGGSSFFKRS